MSRLPMAFFGLIISLTVALNLFVAPKWDPIFFTDAEFTPVDQIARERAHRIWWSFSGILFVDKLKAEEFLCVPAQSSLYQHLSRNSDLSGVSIDSSCEPLDFTDKPGDLLHPNLVTDRVVKSFLYAYDPAYTPREGSAILVEAHGDVLVFVNTDTLANLGLLPTGFDTP
jgi:hypothetical protein